MTKKRRRILFLIFLSAIITILLYCGRYALIEKHYSAYCKLLTNDMNTPELVLDGQYLVLPFSLGDILDAGWEVTETGELAKGEHTTIECTKKNTRITLRVVNQGPTTCVNDPDLTVYFIATNSIDSNKDTFITKFGLCTRSDFNAAEALSDTYPDHFLMHIEYYNAIFSINETRYLFLVNDTGEVVIQLNCYEDSSVLWVFDPELNLKLEGSSYSAYSSYFR